MKTKLFLNLILGFIITIVLAISIFSKQSSSFFIFSKSLLFISSIYFAFRVKDIVGLGGIRSGLILFSACAVLFNPFMPFNITKNIWNIIYIILTAAILQSINVYLKELTNLLTPKLKLKFIYGKTIFWCLTVWVGATLLIFYPTSLYFTKQILLISKPNTTVKGFVTKTFWESEIESETGGKRNSYWFSYYFTTTNGKKVYSNASEDTIVPDKYEGLSEDDQFPIDIVYLNENPENNLPKDQLRESVFSLLRTERVGMSIIILVVGGVISFQILKSSRKKYLKEIQNFQE